MLLRALRSASVRAAGLAAAVVLMAGGQASAQVSLGGHSFTLSGTTSLTTDWSVNLVGSIFNNVSSPTTGSFDPLNVSFSGGGSAITASFYLPLPTDTVYGAANQTTYPLTYSGTLNQATGAFSVSATIGASPIYNYVGFAPVIDIPGLGDLVNAYVYQDYTSGTLTLSGTATNLGGGEVVQLSGLSLTASISNSVIASLSALSPDTGVTISTSNGGLFGAVSIANTLTYTLNGTTTSAPAPSALLVAVPGFAGLLRLRRRAAGLRTGIEA